MKDLHTQTMELMEISKEEPMRGNWQIIGHFVKQLVCIEPSIAIDHILGSFSIESF